MWFVITFIDFSRYYRWIVVPVSIGLPTAICILMFGEVALHAVFVNICRYLLSLHVTWCTNSFSHLLGGSKPFEKWVWSAFLCFKNILQFRRNINPRDSYWIGIIAFGEGWHNYHVIVQFSARKFCCDANNVDLYHVNFNLQHVYPWDYKVSELHRGWCNFSIPFIDFFAWLGWAYDLKTVPAEMVRMRVLRTGDGSHRYSEEASRDGGSKRTERDVAHFWGWGEMVSISFSHSRALLNTNDLLWRSMLGLGGAEGLRFSRMYWKHLRSPSIQGFKISTVCKAYRFVFLTYTIQCSVPL